MKREVQAAQIFRNAAAYIRTYGWQVSGMSEHGLPRCSMGALESASNQKRWDPAMAKLMYSTLYDELNGQTLTEFNHRRRNGEAVAQLFDRVASRLSKRPAITSV